MKRIIASIGLLLSFAITALAQPSGLSPSRSVTANTNGVIQWPMTLALSNATAQRIYVTNGVAIGTNNFDTNSLYATGSIRALMFIGDGSQLTGISVGAVGIASNGGSGVANIFSNATIRGGSFTNLTNATATASRAATYDANGALTSSVVTVTELEHVSGVTGGIQTNIDNRVDTNTFRLFTNSLGTAAYSNSASFQPASSTLTGWAGTPTNAIPRALTNAGGAASLINDSNAPTWKLKSLSGSGVTITDQVTNLLLTASGGGTSITNPRVAYLQTNYAGTPAIGDPSKPYTNAQAALDAIHALSPAPSSDYPAAIIVGAGNFGDVIVSNDSRGISWIGLGPNVSRVGTVTPFDATPRILEWASDHSVCFSNFNFTLNGAAGAAGTGGDPPTAGGNGANGEDGWTVYVTNIFAGAMHFAAGNGGAGGAGGDAYGTDQDGAAGGNGGNGASTTNHVIGCIVLTELTVGPGAGGGGGAGGSGSGAGTSGSSGSSGSAGSGIVNVDGTRIANKLYSSQSSTLSSTVAPDIGGAASGNLIFTSSAEIGGVYRGGDGRITLGAITAGPVDFVQNDSVPLRFDYSFIHFNFGADGRDLRIGLDDSHVAKIDFVRSFTDTFDFGSISSGALASTNITVNSVSADGSCAVQVAIDESVFSGGTNCDDIDVRARVTAADTVTVYLKNHGGSAANPASGKFTVIVTKLKTLNE